MTRPELQTTLPTDLPTTRERVTAALAEQGFGVLTEIDVQATLHKKIGAEIAPYTILGACNPHLAHRALTIDPMIGLLLPCNVVLRQVSGGTQVSVADPRQMFPTRGEADLEALVADAEGRLMKAVAALR